MSLTREHFGEFKVVWRDLTDLGGAVCQRQRFLVSSDPRDHHAGFAAKQQVDRIDSHARRQQTVEGSRAAAALSVSQNGQADFKIDVILF